MKRRGWRVALTMATLGLALVAGFVAFNWATVRDHAEAWWFLLTRETKTIRPKRGFPVGKEMNVAIEGLQPAECVFQHLANYSGRSVIFDRAMLCDEVALDWNQLSMEVVLQTLRHDGFQLVEQRFPYVAYVVVECPEPVPDVVGHRWPRGRYTQSR